MPAAITAKRWDAQRQKRAAAEYLAGFEAETQAQEGGASGRGGSDGQQPASSTRSQAAEGDLAFRSVFNDGDARSNRTYFILKPKRLAADTAYGTGCFLGWLVAPHIPVRDASERDDGTFSRSDFHWDKRRRVYICPNNKVLHTTGTVHDGNMLRYRASKFDCDACALKIRCCPNMAAPTGTP